MAYFNCMLFGNNFLSHVWQCYSKSVPTMLTHAKVRDYLAYEVGENFYMYVLWPSDSFAFLCHIWITNLSNLGQYGKF